MRILLIILLTIPSIAFLKNEEDTNLNHDDVLTLIDSSLNYIRKSGIIGINSMAYLKFTYETSHRFFTTYHYSPFIFKNDIAYSMVMDKAFHLYLSTIISSVNYHLYRGAGFNKKNAIILTATNTMLIGFTKEWIDAHIDVGGFSWIDMLSNMVGVGGALYQEHLWNHQKIIFKYSYRDSPWAQYNPSELGANQFTRMFRDYNAITFWMSTPLSTFINIHSDRSNLGWKDIVSISFGYGVNGMLSQKDNTSIELLHGLEEIFRIREYTLALDLHLSNIPTKSKVLKNLFFVLDHIKIPLPSIQYSSDRNLKFYAFYI